MLQKYKNVLIHINIFQELYNIEQEKVRLQEMYYRYILEYLYPKYNLELLGDFNMDSYKTMESLGFLGYFENIYMPSKTIYTPKDFSSIMQMMSCSDGRLYLTLGKNTNMELDAATRCHISTCKLVESSDLNIDHYATYKINSLEKIKTIL